MNASYQNALIVLQIEWFTIVAIWRDNVKNKPVLLLQIRTTHPLENYYYLWTSSCSSCSSSKTTQVPKSHKWQKQKEEGN